MTGTGILAGAGVLAGAGGLAGTAGRWRGRSGLRAALVLLLGGRLLPSGSLHGDLAGGEREHVLGSGGPHLDEVTFRGLDEVDDFPRPPLGDSDGGSGEPHRRRVARGQFGPQSVEFLVGKCAPHKNLFQPACVELAAWHDAGRLAAQPGTAGHAIGLRSLRPMIIEPRVRHRIPARPPPARRCHRVRCRPGLFGVGQVGVAPVRIDEPRLPGRGSPGRTTSCSADTRVSNSSASIQRGRFGHVDCTSGRAGTGNPPLPPLVRRARLAPCPRSAPAAG